MDISIIYINQNADLNVNDLLSRTNANLIDCIEVKSIDLMLNALKKAIETSDSVVLIGGWPLVPDLVAKSVGYDTYTKNGVKYPEDSKLFSLDGTGVDGCIIEAEEQSIILMKNAKSFSQKALPYLVNKFKLVFDFKAYAGSSANLSDTESSGSLQKNIDIEYDGGNNQTPHNNLPPDNSMFNDDDDEHEDYTPRRSKRPFIIVATLLLTVGVVAATYYFTVGQDAQNVNNNSSQTENTDSQLSSIEWAADPAESVSENTSSNSTSESESSSSQEESSESNTSDEEDDTTASLVAIPNTKTVAATLSSQSVPASSVASSSSVSSSVSSSASSSVASSVASSSVSSSSAKVALNEPATANYSGPTTFTVKNSATGQVVTGSAVDIVSQIVEIEVSSSAPTEAIKAQAVATYSFLAYNTKGGKVPTVHMKTASTQVTDTVKTVEGEMLAYNDQPVNATYFSTSAGYTADSTDIWGGDLPYLKSVDSSYDTAGKYYSTTSSFSATSIATWVYTDYGIDLSSTPEDQWFAVTYDENNTYASSVNIGGVKTVKGTDINNKLLNSSRTGSSYLRSSAYTISYDSATDNFNFLVKGNGHGVGMSQVGAIEMAKQGYTYDEILLHYYSGVTLVK